MGRAHFIEVGVSPSCRLFCFGLALGRISFSVRFERRLNICVCFFCSSIVEFIGVWVCGSDCTLGWDRGWGCCHFWNEWYCCLFGVGRLLLCLFTVFQTGDIDLSVFAGVNNL